MYVALYSKRLLLYVTKKRKERKTTQSHYSFLLLPFPLKIPTDRKALILSASHLQDSWSIANLNMESFTTKQMGNSNCSKHWGKKKKKHAENQSNLSEQSIVSWSHSRHCILLLLTGVVSRLAQELPDSYIGDKTRKGSGLSPKYVFLKAFSSKSIWQMK